MGENNLFSFSSLPTPQQVGKRQRQELGAASQAGSAPAVFMEADRELLQDSAHLSLINSGQIRHLKAVTGTVHIAEATAPSIVAVSAAGELYSQKVKGSKKHEGGPPHPHLAAALISSAHANSGNEGVKRKLIPIVEKVNNREKMAAYLPMIQYGKAYAKKVRLEISYSYTAEADGLPEIINATLAERGAERKLGAAPRGPLPFWLKAPSARVCSLLPLDRSSLFRV